MDPSSKDNKHVIAYVRAAVANADAEAERLNTAERLGIRSFDRPRIKWRDGLASGKRPHCHVLWRDKATHRLHNYRSYAELQDGDHRWLAVCAGDAVPPDARARAEASAAAFDDWLLATTEHQFRAQQTPRDNAPQSKEKRRLFPRAR